MTNTIHNHSHDHSRLQADIKSFIDPVCGMSTEDEAAFTEHEYKGTTYYFCSDHCLAKFKENPDAYGARETKDCCHIGHGEKIDHSTGCCHGGHAEKTDHSTGCCHGNN